VASSSHSTLRGQTVDNLETAAMDPDAADVLARSLESQIGQHGDWGGNVLGGVLVPRNIYKHTKEVFNSTLIADSAENNLNIFDTDYGQVSIKQSPLLSSTFNAGSNANTAYHFVGQNHHIVRRALVGMNMTMIEPQYTATDSYVERVRFAEVTYNLRLLLVTVVNKLSKLQGHLMETICSETQKWGRSTTIMTYPVFAG